MGCPNFFKYHPGAGVAEYMERFSIESYTEAVEEIKSFDMDSYREAEILGYSPVEISGEPQLGVISDFNDYSAPLHPEVFPEMDQEPSQECFTDINSYLDLFEDSVVAGYFSLEKEPEYPAVETDEEADLESSPEQEEKEREESLEKEKDEDSEPDSLDLLEIIDDAFDLLLETSNLSS